MTRLYQGTMVVADLLPEESHSGWIFIEWLYPGENKFTAVKDVRRIEKEIRAQQLKGWLASSEKDHTTMHQILEKMGARCYGSDEHAFHFMKEVA